MIRAGFFQCLAVRIAVGDPAGEGAGPLSHEDVHGHVSYHQGFIGPEVKVSQGLEDGFGVGFGCGDVVGPWAMRESAGMPLS